MTLASSKKWTPRQESFLLLFFHQELARLCLLKEVKPSPDRKVIKLPTFDILFPPATTFSLKLVVD